MKLRPFDRRNADAILANPRWDSYLGAMDLRRMVADRTLPLALLREADLFLAWCERENVATLDEAVVDAYCGERRSADIPVKLRKAFSVLSAGDPAIVVFEKVARRRWADDRRRKAGAACPTEGGASPEKPQQPIGSKGKTLRVSIPEAKLPASWRCALTEMRAGLEGVAIRAPVPSITKSVALQMRQFAFSALQAGLPVAIGRDQLKAHMAALRARGLRPGTMMAATSRLLTFMLYTAPDDPLLPSVRRLAARWEARSNEEISLREQNAARLPGLAGIQQQAAALLQRSCDTRNPRSAQHQRNAALALAFPTQLPLRLADLNLVFGKELLWDGSSWVLETTVSKTGDAARHYRTRIDPWLAPFLDAVVLHGAAPEHLPALRAACIAERRAIFVDRNGDTCTYGFVSRMWKRYLGTGAHVVRSLVHDDLGAQGDAGVREALIACGQTSVAIAKVYQTRNHNRRAHAAVQKAMVDALDESTLKAFDDAALPGPGQAAQG